MDTAGWPGWVFSALVGVVAAVLTRSAAVKAALISAQAAPYEAMATRLARLEEERDKSEREQDLLRAQWETERKTLEVAWAHERAQVVRSMGTIAHELFQLKASLGQIPALVDWVDNGCPAPSPQIHHELRALAQQLNGSTEMHPRGSE